MEKSIPMNTDRTLSIFVLLFRATNPRAKPCVCLLESASGNQVTFEKFYVKLTRVKVASDRSIFPLRKMKDWGTIIKTLQPDILMPQNTGWMLETTFGSRFWTLKHMECAHK